MKRSPQVTSGFAALFASALLSHAGAKPGDVDLAVEAPTKLTNWGMIGVAPAVRDGQFNFEDAQAARHSSRFYRVRVQ